MAVKKIETLNKHQNPATNENEFDIENYMNVNWDKIKEVVDNNADELTTTQGKVTTLETDNTNNKSDIQELQSKNEEQDKKIETIEAEQESQNDLLQRTQSALINITTEKSSNINVKDSSNLNAKIGVFGTSSQETREGYNLLNVASEFEVTGRSRAIAISLKANTDYTIKVDNIETTNENPTTLAISFRDESDASVRDVAFPYTGRKTTFQVTGEATKVYIYSANNYNDSQGITTTYKNLMIYEGTDDKTYEEYGETPSPEISSEIENVTGDIDVIITNENLAVADWAERFVNVVNNNSKARLEETDGRKCLFYNANAGYQNDDAYFFKYIFKKNTRYTISFYIRPSTTQGNFAIKYADGSIGSIQNLIAGEWQKVVINTKSNATVEEVRVQYLSGNCRIDLDTIQITEGATEKEYIKNQGQTITFPLQEGQRLADGDKLGDDGIHHVRKQFIVNGTENIYRVELLSTGYIRFNLSKQGCTGTYGGATTIRFCNIFKSEELKRWDILTLNENVIGIASYTDQLKIVIKNIFGITEADNLDTMKSKVSSWLQNNNIVVEEVVDEYVEEYTEEQQEAYNKLQNVLSYKTVTNVFTDKALLEFKYIADTQTWVLNKINNTNQQVLNIAGGN